MRRFRNLLPALVSALLMAGPTIAAAADAPAAVASIKPIHSLLAGVMEGVGRPRLLVKGGASPHTYSLRPSEAQVLAEADFVVWVGEFLESFLTRPIQALAADAHVLELMRAEGVALLPVRTGGVWDAHDHHDEDAGDAHGHDEDAGDAHGHDEDAGDAHGHDEDAGDAHGHDEDAGDGHGHDEDAHGHDEDAGDAHGHDEDAGDEHVRREDGHEHHEDELDNHLWLDPVNAAAIVDAMAEALSLLDPGRAGIYRGNAATVQARLRALDAEIGEALAPVSDRGFVVFHDAWQYFGNRYGLREVGSVTVSPDQAPGASRLAEIRERLIDAKAECVFAEPQFESGLVRTLVAGTGAGTGVLDPLGAAIDDGPDLYFTLMRANAAAIRACFGR